MGEASSVKVSDIEKFASCNLGNTFKVWSLVYTWRYSSDQDECIGFVVQQWLGKSSGSRRVWSCPQEMGQCEGGAQPFLGCADSKGTFWAIPVSLPLQGHSHPPGMSIGRACGGMWVGTTKPGPGRDPKPEFAEQTNKQKTLFIAMQ